jgi:ssDNA-binding Zn-finger/Zn-ribbon topoisomerase 1
MYNFVSLTVKCPLCGASLMDEEVLVDNEPSIKLKIEVENKVGTINLSSIYGSYNYICSFDVPQNAIATFICPNCNQVINSKEECKVCRAPLVPFHLDMGGQVNICSRAGCRNHFVEFEDLTNALARFYQEYGYLNKTKTDEFEEVGKPSEVETDENVEIIESGTFLYAYCPFCKRSLIESDMLKLKIVNPKGEVGYIMLSPYLNVFSSKSTIFLPEGKPVGDLRCFHCDSSLMVDEKEKVCEVCSSPIARISISARSKLIDFYICSKKGCRWHGLSEDDLNEIRLEDSIEW